MKESKNNGEFITREAIPPIINAKPISAKQILEQLNNIKTDSEVVSEKETIMGEKEYTGKLVTEEVDFPGVTIPPSGPVTAEKINQAFHMIKAASEVSDEKENLTNMDLFEEK